MNTVDIIVDLNTTQEHMRAADGYEEGGTLIFGETPRTYTKTRGLLERLIKEAEVAFLKANQREILSLAADFARHELEGCKKYLDEALEEPE